MPELLAYMVSIMKAGSKYAGLAWVQYNFAYHQQAASTENRKRSSVNPSLYSVCFTGKALSGPRCSLCVSAEHAVRYCSFSTKSDIERTLEAVMTVCAPRAGGVGGLGSSSISTEVCRRYNEMRCTLQWCRYKHACLTCGGPHPAKQCQGDTRPFQGSQQGLKRPRY